MKVSWVPTNNREREAIRKHGKEWIKIDVRMVPMPTDKIFIESPDGKDARWIFLNQIALPTNGG